MKLISTNYIPKNSLCVSHNSKVINLQKKMPLCVQFTNTPSLLAIILDPIFSRTSTLAFATKYF